MLVDLLADFVEDCLSGSLAEFLCGHPQVPVVHYPGIPGSKTHAAAKKLLHGGYGGMLSFAVNGGLQAAKAVIDGLKLTELVPNIFL